MKRNAAAQIHEIPGLRERKKARLRQQIIETAIRLFRKQGYEKTRIDDIVKILEISQPTFFRYFPSKDAVLRPACCRAGARDIIATPLLGFLQGDRCMRVGNVKRANPLVFDEWRKAPQP